MMKQETLLKKLGNILEDLNDQYQFLSQNPEQLSEIELELFLANASFLADHIKIVKKLNLPLYVPVGVKEAYTEVSEKFELTQHATQEDAALIADRSEKVEEPLAIIPQDDPIDENPEVDKFEGVPFELEDESSQTFEFVLNTNKDDADNKLQFEENSAEDLLAKSFSEDEELNLAQEPEESFSNDAGQAEEDEIGPEPFLVHREEDSEIFQAIEDTPEEEMPAPVEVSRVTIETTKVEVETTYQPTLNDILSQQNASNKINETAGAPLSDLKSAINLNDKLLYIKDLFNGYNLAYAEAIDIANKMPNFEAADNFLQKNYAVKNNWANNQLTVDKFYTLLNRRFS